MIKPNDVFSLKKILNNSFHNAYLIISEDEKESTTVLKNIAKHFVCKKDICNSCEYCLKINQNKYFDSFTFDCLTSVKKSQITEMLNEFQYSTLEKTGIKFCFIKNIEFANLFVSNVLLKTIEAPISKIIFLFSCKNLRKVLKTVVSRSFLIKLLPTEKKKPDKSESLNPKLQVIENIFTNYVEKKPVSYNDLMMINSKENIALLIEKLIDFFHSKREIEKIIVLAKIKDDLYENTNHNICKIKIMKLLIDK